MEWLSIKAEPREDKGTRACYHLRKKGMVPAIVYGRKEPEAMITVNGKKFGEILNKGARLINLALAEKTEKVFIKEVQFDPVEEELIHIDFNRIAMDEMLTMEVEIKLKGQPKGIIEGGVLEQNLRQLEIKCLPDNIPSSIEMDIANLEIGDVIRAKDLTLPKGVTAVTDPEIVVAGVHQPKVEEVAPVGEVTATEPEVIGAEKEAPEEGEEEKAAVKEEKKPAAKEEKKPAAKEEKK